VIVKCAFIDLAACRRSQDHASSWYWWLI